MKKIFYIFIFSLIIIININSKENLMINDFIEANNLYTNKDIVNALDKYLYVFKNGYDNFEVNYNIGCCYFKLKEYGKSRFYFERALNYKPFDPDLFQNLSVLYKIIQKNPFYGEQLIMNKRIIYFIPIYLTIIILLFFTLLMLISLFILYIKKNNKKNFLILFTIFSIFTIFFIIIFSIQYFDFNSNIFIIKSNDANIYLAPNEVETVLTPITEGTKGKILEKINGYIRIKLNDGLSGWIKEENIISIQKILDS